MTTLHYASGGSASQVATAGFNLVDVSSVDELNALPAGTKGLVWLDEANGATSSFIQKVTPFIGNPKVFGFFLVDEPDPTGKWGTYATAANLKAESDWIHSNLPGAKTFITMMNMGSSANPDFSNTYNPANTHIDYYGLDPYPVRTGTSTVDYNMIDRTVAAAVASGIPVSQIVPVYQTFGGGSFTTDTGGQYVLPSVTQEQTMLDHWSKLVPTPAFDYAYAWGSQQGDTALGNSPALQALFLQHNQSDAGTSSSGGTGSSGGTTTVTPPPTTTTPVPPTTSTPSSSDHVFYGTGGADVMHGTTGADTMAGRGYNDTYYVDNVGDKVVEVKGGGNDTVLASVSYALSAGSEIEHLATTSRSGTTAINLTGNEFSQTIEGNAGNNVINGGGGRDVLTGHGGKDVFVFNSALKAGNVDKITDFNAYQDKIQLDHSIFSGLQKGALPTSAFFAGAGAHDSNDHIIYNSLTGALSFDSDGTGRAHQIQFATLSPHLSLTASSFIVT
ncbi:MULTISPECIES: calcium-binding protein [Mesorhizobium]|jgi:Ca2+-binding RTX toxin-like protein|uniref:DNA-binding protein n=1 Tax=Rhizobium loti TaxID=381 RepID=A0A6M7U1X9_RHILI|nr:MULTISPECIES: calcium-binding protein [Mesorhizobium]KRB29144.1 DNA-binding protein [Mesorhizobium sp. Root172]OBQ70561.1 DNA-binding protein [Mesorhizobium loti]QKC70103.1 calcium-binding protein [Mesorhizobium loti]QKC92015.1 calcium-binding protein [Mesorhizobium sp. NZP2234]